MAWGVLCATDAILTNQADHPRSSNASEHASRSVCTGLKEPARAQFPGRDEATFRAEKKPSLRYRHAAARNVLTTTGWRLRPVTKKTPTDPSGNRPGSTVPMGTLFHACSVIHKRDLQRPAEREPSRFNGSDGHAFPRMQRDPQTRPPASSRAGTVPVHRLRFAELSPQPRVRPQTWSQARARRCKQPVRSEPPCGIAPPHARRSTMGCVRRPGRTSG